MKEGWEYKKLIDVCDFQGGSQPPKSEWINHDSPGYIRMLQIRDFTQSRKVSPEYVKLTNRTKCCFSDDILIGRYGASLGKILTGIAGAYNVAIMRTIPNETLLSKGYLKYYLMSSIFQSFLLNIGGRAAQAGFNKEDLKCLNIPITTLDQQRRIVSYLDSSFKLIDEIKNKALKSLTEAKALFQSALDEAMEPKVGWEYKKIYEVGQVVGGTTPSTNNPNYWNGDLCWISPAELTGNHYLYDSRKKITQEAVNSKSLKLLPVGTVILSSRAPIGKVTINKVPTYCNQGFKCVICKDSLYNEYLYWWFYGHTKFLNSLGTGATFAEISKKVVENIIITIPSIDEQSQIVSHLDSLSSKVRAIEEKYQRIVAECDAMKQAMLREVFE